MDSPDSAVGQPVLTGADVPVPEESAVGPVDLTEDIKPQVVIKKFGNKEMELGEKTEADLMSGITTLAES
jgi:hypothetical protein